MEKFKQKPKKGDGQVTDIDSARRIKELEAIANSQPGSHVVEEGLQFEVEGRDEFEKQRQLALEAITDTSEPHLFLRAAKQFLIPNGRLDGADTYHNQDLTKLAIGYAAIGEPDEANHLLSTIWMPDKKTIQQYIKGKQSTLEGQALARARVAYFSNWMGGISNKENVAQFAEEYKNPSSMFMASLPHGDQFNDYVDADENGYIVEPNQAYIAKRQETYRQAKELFDQGVKVTEIADQLKEKFGKDHWTPNEIMIDLLVDMAIERYKESEAV